MIVCLCGPSGSGKTTCAKLLAEKGYKRRVSSTTRKPRVGETNGVDYNFVSVKEFIDMILCNEFVEYTEYDDNFYGSPKQLDGFEVRVVEPNGLMSLKTQYPGEVIGFYLEASQEVTSDRVQKRDGGISDTVLRRMAVDYDMIKYDCFDVIIASEEEIGEKLVDITNEISNWLYKMGYVARVG